MEQELRQSRWCERNPRIHSRVRFAGPLARTRDGVDSLGRKTKTKMVTAAAELHVALLRLELYVRGIAVRPQPEPNDQRCRPSVNDGAT
jgi:hypothetical protein